MVTCGIDIGSYAIKLIVMEEKEVIASRVVPTGENVKASAEDIFRDHLSGVIHRFGRPLRCDGHWEERGRFRRRLGVGYCRRHPRGDPILSFRSEQLLISEPKRCGSSNVMPDGNVLNYLRNNRCAAGAGTFLESMARTLEVSLDDMGILALSSFNEIHITSTCVVFSESEVVSLVHSNVEKADIARAISESIAMKTVSLVNRVVPDQDIVFIGGVARNESVARELEKVVGFPVRVPAEPQIAGALGAAMIAQKSEGNNMFFDHSEEYWRWEEHTWHSGREWKQCRHRYRRSRRGVGQFQSGHYDGK